MSLYFNNGFVDLESNEFNIVIDMATDPKNVRCLLDYPEEADSRNYSFFGALKQHTPSEIRYMEWALGKFLYVSLFEPRPFFLVYKSCTALEWRDSLEKALQALFPKYIEKNIEEVLNYASKAYYMDFKGKHLHLTNGNTGGVKTPILIFCDENSHIYNKLKNDSAMILHFRTSGRPLSNFSPPPLHDTGIMTKLIVECMHLYLNHPNLVQPNYLYWYNYLYKETSGVHVLTAFVQLYACTGALTSMCDSVSWPFIRLDMYHKYFLKFLDHTGYKRIEKHDFIQLLRVTDHKISDNLKNVYGVTLKKVAIKHDFGM